MGLKGGDSRMHTRSIFVIAIALSFCSTAHAQEPTVNGFMVTAAVSQALSNAGVEGGVRYWDDYVGADVNLGIERAALDASGTDIIKQTDITVGAGVLLGVPIGRIKPHIRVGFSYSYTKDYVSDIKIQTYDIEPSVGVDFMASEHLMFGMDILSYPFLISGNVNGTDIGGSDFSFLNQLRMAYVF